MWRSSGAQSQLRRQRCTSFCLKVDAATWLKSILVRHARAVVKCFLLYLQNNLIYLVICLLQLVISWQHDEQTERTMGILIMQQNIKSELLPMRLWGGHCARKTTQLLIYLKLQNLTILSLNERMTWIRYSIWFKLNMLKSVHDFNSDS